MNEIGLLSKNADLTPIKLSMPTFYVISSATLNNGPLATSMGKKADKFALTNKF